jgi:hypothetical protein
MTLPDERTRAILQARQFLLDLMTPSETPRVPREIRDRARSVLRHYPLPYEVEVIAKNSDLLDKKYAKKVLKNDDK